MKKTVLNIFTLLTLFCLLSCSNQKDQNSDDLKQEVNATEQQPPKLEPITQISSIAGKKMSEVEQLLGKPDKVEKSKPSGTPCKENPCDKAYFQSGKFEVLFINEKADWITINKVSNYEIGTNNIELLGLPKSSPTFNNPSSVVRWENISNIREISFFDNGSGKIDYIYVKVQTK